MAIIGTFTGLFAATIAFTQNDIKRVLAYSTISQLGFIPPGLGLEAVEVSPRTGTADARAALGLGEDLPIVRFSHAHKPEEIGAVVTEFLVAAPTIEEIRKALAGRDGRRTDPS